jgi:hypothetical protein
MRSVIGMWTSSRYRFTFACALFLLGSSINLSFRLGSGADLGPFVLAASFSESSDLNTDTEYRFNNHGTIVAVDRTLYDENIHLALSVLMLQVACWVPAVLFFKPIRQHSASARFMGYALFSAGVAVWLYSECLSTGLFF